MNCDGEKRTIDEQARIVPKETPMPDCSESLRSGSAARCAVFAMASLVSSGTTRGEPRFVPRSASIASELAGKVTAIGWAGSKSPSTSCPRTARGLYDGPDLTTRQGIFRDGTDFAPRCQNHDRLSDCGSA